MNTATFALDPRLNQDTVFILDAPLSRIGLMNDVRFPWLILVPRVAGAREWLDLDPSQQTQLQAEINACSTALRSVYPEGEKLNIAALGNVVSQLHVHVISRHSKDAAWPNPVWGFGQRKLYDGHEIERVASKLNQILSAHLNI